MKLKRMRYAFRKYGLILAIYFFLFLYCLNGEGTGGFFPLYVKSFGGIIAEQDVDFLITLFHIIPCILVLYAFSSLMRDDFEISSAYVFTRMGKKSRWLYRKTGEIFLWVVFAYFLLFLLAFLVGFCTGLRPQAFSPEKAGGYAALFFCNAGTMFFFVFLLNVLSLRHGTTHAFLFTLLFYLFSLAAAFILYGKSPAANFILCLLPLSQQMYLWHAESAPLTGWIYQNQLSGFRMPVSVAVLCIWTAAVYVIAYLRIKKLDTVELIKEE